MKKWRITVTPQFSEELRDIHSYISTTLLEPVIAKRFTGKVLESVKGLGELPERYPLYDKEPWKKRGLRKMTVDNYVVFYLTNEKTREVVVLHIFYGGRNIEKCLSEPGEAE